MRECPHFSCGAPVFCGTSGLARAAVSLSRAATVASDIQGTRLRVDRVKDEVPVGSQAELLHDVGAVCLRCARADPQPLANGGVAEALRSEVQDLPVPRHNRIRRAVGTRASPGGQ